MVVLGNTNKTNWDKFKDTSSALSIIACMAEKHKYVTFDKAEGLGLVWKQQLIHFVGLIRA